MGHALALLPLYRTSTRVASSLVTARIVQPLRAALFPITQALSAVSSTRHTLSPKTLSSVLGALGPQLDELTHGQQMQLVRVLSNPGGMPAKPIAAGFLAALTHAVSSSRGGLGSAPSELLFAVVGAAARWGVPLDQGWLEEAEQELVGRLAVEGGAPAAGAMEQPVLRQQLLRGIIAPLATLGQELSKVCAVGRSSPTPAGCLGPQKCTLALLVVTPRFSNPMLVHRNACWSACFWT